MFILGGTTAYLLVLYLFHNYGRVPGCQFFMTNRQRNLYNQLMVH